MPRPERSRLVVGLRALFEYVAAIGGRHTSTPERAWFAVWEGYGFDGGTNSIAWPTPGIDEDTIGQREAEQARLAEETARRYAAIRAALDEVPRIHVPNRAYYVVEGAVSAVSQLRYPDSPNEWRNPDLFWPDDRRWFAATDVDFWSVYVGGDEEHLAELATKSPTPIEYVASERPLGDRDLTALPDVAIPARSIDGKKPVGPPRRLSPHRTGQSVRVLSTCPVSPGPTTTGTSG